MLIQKRHYSVRNRMFMEYFSLPKYKITLVKKFSALPFASSALLYTSEQIHEKMTSVVNVKYIFGINAYDTFIT